MSDQTVQATQAVVEPKTEPAQAATQVVTEPVGNDGKPFDPERAQKTIESLRDEIKALKPKAKLADELTEAEKKRKEAEMTELQKLEVKLHELEAENKTTKLSLLRSKVGTKFNLPTEIAELLPDLPEAEMEAKAEALAKAIPAKQAPNLNPNNPGANNNAKVSDEDRKAFMFGNGSLPS